MGAIQRFSIVVRDLKDIQEVRKVLEVVNEYLELNLPVQIDETFERDVICGDYPAIYIGKGTEAYSIEICHENYYSNGLFEDLFALKQELRKGFKGVWIGHLDLEELNEV